MSISRTIWVTFRKEGIHHYPAALTDLRLIEIGFTGHPHRHIFHFRVEVEVFTDDRDIEFILFKRELERVIDQQIVDISYHSCEMIAEKLIGYIAKKYPGRNIQVQVAEDGENGSTVTYIKEPQAKKPLGNNQTKTAVSV